MRANLACSFLFIYMTTEQIASAVVNDLYAGNVVKLDDRNHISIEQLEDEVIDCRNTLIKEMYIKGILNLSDIFTSINCIEVDCKDQNKCSCNSSVLNPKMAKHFEIPQLLAGLGQDSIKYIGSTDRSNSFKIYYDLESTEYIKYKKNFKNKPYVYIEKTPNENGMYDGWIFNAPFIKYIAVIGVFKDPRQLKQYNCCNETDYMEVGSISDEVKNRLLNRKLNIYRTPAPFTAKTV